MKNNDYNETPLHSIGTVARMLGVSVQTLRMYERRGLILAQKSAGNQRLYSQSDIERLKCIRTAISNHKISIEGIRRIQSMVPCWENVQCPMEQRVECPAYTAFDAGCWTYKHKTNVCAGRDCLHCKVYLLSGDCGQIKSLVHHQPAPLSDTTDVLQKGK
ncbi:MAG: MerR family transcriptional regulator [Ignavibacteriales bacterium]|nr:MerR family transcriptional regulator [Ignavibacteriales bacterium]